MDVDSAKPGQGAPDDEATPAKAPEPEAAASTPRPAARRTTTPKKVGDKPNNLRKVRMERMLSKAELARRANISVLTIDRIEKGFGSRLDTKRKLLEALGLSLADRASVFGEEE